MLAAKDCRNRRSKSLFLILAVAPLYLGRGSTKATDAEQLKNFITDEKDLPINSSSTNHLLVHKPSDTRKMINISNTANSKNSTNHSVIKTVKSNAKNQSMCSKIPPIQVQLVQQVLSANSSHNATKIQKGKHSNLHILEYVLIPVGSLLLCVLLFIGFRHWQKVQKKRRLERELVHQYSYPNSEADEDLDYQNLPEVETVVNSQFVAYTDQSSKMLFDDNLPEVAVSMGGERAKLVLQEAPSNDGNEQSTNFNC